MDYMDRIIGRKAIIAVFGKMYGIHSWSGARKHILRNHFPLRRTLSGRPMFYTHELVMFDSRVQALLLETKHP